MREQRQKERALHKEALAFYYRHMNNSAEQAHVLNRNNIKRIKRLLVAKKEEYADLRERYSGSSEERDADNNEAAEVSEQDILELYEKSSGQQVKRATR